jgi:hypothetical protein
LIDGALGAGWSPGQPNITDYHWAELFHILTGEEIVLVDSTGMGSNTLCQYWQLIQRIPLILQGTTISPKPTALQF